MMVSVSPTLAAGDAVSPKASNLSPSSPDRVPQYQTTGKRSWPGTFTANSPDRSIKWCENRAGATAIASIGGSMLTGVAHAKVMMLRTPP